eukprot:s837_g5.t1
MASGSTQERSAGSCHSGGDSTAVRRQLKNVQRVRATEYVFAAILADGTVVTWGYACDSSAVRGQLKNVQRAHATEYAFAAIEPWRLTAVQSGVNSRTFSRFMPQRVLLLPFWPMEPDVDLVAVRSQLKRSAGSLRNSIGPAMTSFHQALTYLNCQAEQRRICHCACAFNSLREAPAWSIGCTKIQAAGQGSRQGPAPHILPLRLCPGPG